MSTAPVGKILGTGAAAATFTTASYTPQANSRELAYVSAFKTTLPFNAVTIVDSAGNNWTQLATFDTTTAANPNIRGTWFISDDTGGSPAARTVTVASTGVQGLGVIIADVLSVDVSGTIVQSAAVEDLANGDPSITFGSVPGASNIVLLGASFGGGNLSTKPASFTSIAAAVPTAARYNAVSYDIVSASQGPLQYTSGNIRSILIGIELAPAAGGTNTPVGLTTTVTTTGSIAKLTGKIASAVATTSGVLARAGGKLLSATATSTGSIVKLTAKSLATTVTTTATILKQIRKTLSATVTTVASVLIGGPPIIVTLNTTVTTTSTLVRQARKVLAANATTLASLVVVSSVKIVQLLATATTTSSVKRGVTRRLQATATITSSLAKSVLKRFAATVTSTGTLVKRVGKILLAPVTVLVTLISSAGTTYPIGLLATVTTTASVRRRIDKSLAIVVSSSTTLLKQIRKSFTNTISLFASLTSSAKVSILALTNRLLSASSEDRKLYAYEDLRKIYTVREDRVLVTTAEDDTLVSEN